MAFGMQDEVLIAGFGRRGHAVGDIPGVRFKVRVLQMCLVRGNLMWPAVSALLSVCFKCCTTPCAIKGRALTSVRTKFVQSKSS